VTGPASDASDSGRLVGVAIDRGAAGWQVSTRAGVTYSVLTRTEALAHIGDTQSTGWNSGSMGRSS
jgi:hypothetical protein